MGNKKVNRIKAVIVERGYKAKDVASALNIPSSSFSNYLRNVHQPDSETLVKIAGFLNVTPNDLLNYKEVA